MVKDQKSLLLRLIPLLAVIVLIFLGVGIYQLNDNSSKTTPVEKKYKYDWGNHSQNKSTNTNPYLGTPCIPNPKVEFTNDFTDVNLIGSVEPTIITPGNPRHRAWLNIVSGKVPVYAPIDSELVNGVYKNARGALDYDLHFQVSCEIWYLINHVTEPVEKIKDAFPSTPQTDTKTSPPFQNSISVKAGELIGYTTGTPNARNFDFGVFDLSHVNPGLPADDGSEYGKEKNFICPFDVLPQDIRKLYYSKIIPSEKPYSNCQQY